jgi:hypothetical protein
MVIGQTFAWGHLPKTAGKATVAMFGLFPDVILSADPAGEHVPFASREAQIGDRMLVGNLRRLPNWTLSWAHWRAHPLREGDHPLDSPAQMASVPRADQILAVFTDHGRFHIDRWLRMEQLAEDFTAFVSGLRELSDEERHKIAAFEQVNALDYEHDVLQWFTPRQIRRMYERNPAWAAAEQRVYGDLVLADR